MGQKSWTSPIFGPFPRNGDFIRLSRNYHEFQHNAALPTSFKFTVNSYYFPSPHVDATVNSNKARPTEFISPFLL